MELDTNAASEGGLWYMVLKSDLIAGGLFIQLSEEDFSLNWIVHSSAQFALAWRSAWCLI